MEKGWFNAKAARDRVVALRGDLDTFDRYQSSSYFSPTLPGLVGAVGRLFSELECRLAGRREWGRSCLLVRLRELDTRPFIQKA